MKKILYISNISSQRFNTSFCRSAMEAAKDLDIDFSYAANRNHPTKEQVDEDEKEYGIHLYHIDLARMPYSKWNIKAYHQLVELINREKFDVIHCNTPVGGLLGRLVGKKCGIKTVIYQVHGFHFYKGAPLKNWLLYYPIEKWLAHYTDVLITINQEDYELATRKFKLRNNGKVYYVPGVGIDLKMYQEVNNREKIRCQKRKEIGLKDSDSVLISVGRLDKNKNNEAIIRAVHLCKRSNIHLVICGDGDEKDNLKNLVNHLNIEQQIHFLGNRTDMMELYEMADIFVMASYREGLSRSIMEAMACGLPCVVSDIRGNRDLVVNGKGGYLFNPHDSTSLANYLHLAIDNEVNRYNMGKFNLARIGKFDLTSVTKNIEEIYKKV